MPCVATEFRYIAPPPTKKEMTRKVQELGKLFQAGREPDLGTERREKHETCQATIQEEDMDKAEVRPI